ncbi:hypothetical protein NOZE110980_13050 [Nocardioides zeicaulis]
MVHELVHVETGRVEPEVPGLDTGEVQDVLDQHVEQAPGATHPADEGLFLG